MPDENIITALYPEPTGLKLSAITPHPKRLDITLSSTRQTVNCPLCDTPTSSLHSHYARHPMDLPVGDHAVNLTLNVRGFRCRNPSCARRVFVERLPDVIAVQARKTARLQTWIAQVGLELGGEAVACLAKATACSISGNTILRRVRTLPAPKLEIPEAIGIDEFAFKRGHTYGTVIVNLETGKPIDLLPDREVITVSTWLKAHPGARFIARDRSTGFAEAISLGAPAARQVLDRWHVLKNLYTAFENQLKRVQNVIDEISPAFKTETWLGPFQRSRKELETQQASLEARRVRHEKIRALQGKGMNVSAIARELGVSRWMVHQAIRTDAPPQVRVIKRRASNLDPWLAFLKLRWTQGVRQTQTLRGRVQTPRRATRTDRRYQQDCKQPRHQRQYARTLETRA